MPGSRTALRGPEAHGGKGTCRCAAGQLVNVGGYPAVTIAAASTSRPCPAERAQGMP